MANVKNNIKQQALEIICSSHGISRSSLADRISVSAVTAGKTAAYLLECGAVIQRTGKSDGGARKTLLLYPNPNLHSFVFDSSVGKLYCIHIGTKPKLIADYGDSCRRDAASLANVLGSAAELISTYKYKKYCIGAFLLMSGSIIVPCQTEFEAKPCHGILSACSDEGNLTLHLSPCGISYAFGKTASADITDAFEEARRVYSCFSELCSLSDAAKAVAKLTASMASIFNPSSVIISQNVFDRTVFAELVTSQLPSKVKTADLIFADRDAIVSYTSDTAIRNYIKSI